MGGDAQIAAFIILITLIEYGGAIIDHAWDLIGPGRTGPGRAGPAPAWPSRAGPGRPDQAQHGPARRGAARSGPGRFQNNEFWLGEPDLDGNSRRDTNDF